MKLKQLCFLHEETNVVIILLEGEVGESSQGRQRVFEISDWEKLLPRETI